MKTRTMPDIMRARISSNVMFIFNHMASDTHMSVGEAAQDAIKKVMGRSSDIVDDIEPVVKNKRYSINAPSEFSCIVEDGFSKRIANWVEAEAIDYDSFVEYAMLEALANGGRIDVERYKNDGSAIPLKLDYKLPETSVLFNVVCDSFLKKTFDDWCHEVGFETKKQALYYVLKMALTNPEIKPEHFRSKSELNKLPPSNRLFSVRCTPSMNADFRQWVKQEGSFVSIRQALEYALRSAIAHDGKAVARNRLIHGL